MSYLTYEQQVEQIVQVEIQKILSPDKVLKQLSNALFEMQQRWPNQPNECPQQ